MRWCPDGDFYDFLRPVFAASPVQHVSDLHLKFALRPTMCASMVETQSATAEIRRGKKKRRKKNKRQDENIYGLPYYIYRAAINNGRYTDAGNCSSFHATRSNH